jgi:hypothetical protein
VSWAKNAGSSFVEDMAATFPEFRQRQAASEQNITMIEHHHGARNAIKNPPDDLREDALGEGKVRECTTQVLDVKSHMAILVANDLSKHCAQDLVARAVM